MKNKEYKLPEEFKFENGSTISLKGIDFSNSEDQTCVGLNYNNLYIQYSKEEVKKEWLNYCKKNAAISLSQYIEKFFSEI